MSERENQPSGKLPQDLAFFLKSRDYACVMQQTKLGTAFIFKAPYYELTDLSGMVGVAVNHELYNTPSAPVIRSTIIWFDRPDSQLAFETFTNIRSVSQSAEFEALASQEDYLCVFYDETMQLKLAKRIRNHQQEQLGAIAKAAKALSDQLTDDQYDFDQAKVVVVGHTVL